jgi:drug/metabolite transporter (DMT)-like permease
MTAPSRFWIVFVIFAASAQTGRNVVQRALTAPLGPWGATNVRFLWGAPFAILFLTGVHLVQHRALPHPANGFWFWIVAGSLGQIFGTALMLMTMKLRSFVVSTAYLKTEPVFVALFGTVFLADAITLPMLAAILIAVAGVMVMSFKTGADYADTRAALVGTGSGLAFAVAAIGFRGAILSLHLSDYLMAATFTLATGLIIQSVLLTGWLAIRDLPSLKATLRLWKQCLLGGFLGALASEFWFLGFALTSAANVRTLGLIDVIFAQGVSSFVHLHPTTRREYAGIAILLAGAILLVVVHR